MLPYNKYCLIVLSSYFKKNQSYTIMCLFSCWNLKQNWKSYFPGNKHSGFDLDLPSNNKLPYENCCFVGCSVGTRQKDIGTLKILSARYVAKK